MSESGRNSAEHLAVGGGLVGAGMAGRAAVGWDARKRKMPSMVEAIMSGKVTRRHVGHTAARIGARGLVMSGVPLAAYGAYTALRPKAMPARKLDYKQDVVKPFANGATFRDVSDKVHLRGGVKQVKEKAKAHAERVHGSGVVKRDLTRTETTNLVHRKERGRKISTAAGVMGLSALALRAPEAAKLAAAKSPAIARRVGRLARREPDATRASNALGVVAIGTGSAGSLNYAAQQKLEAQQFKKGLPSAMGKPPSYQVKKRDDRFLREHRDRISPEAEKGYRYLRSGRNALAADSAVSGGFAGLAAGLSAHSLRRGSKGWAAIGGASAALGGVNAVRSGRASARWNSKMGKIKAKGVERAAVGEYGRGRVVKASGRDVAEIGAGTGLIYAGVKGGKIASAASVKARELVDLKHVNDVKPYRAIIPVTDMGRPMPPRVNNYISSMHGTKPNPDKAGSKAARKKAAGAVSELNRVRNSRLRAVARVTGRNPRIAAMSTAMMSGTALAWHGGRNAVKKKLDHNDVDAGVAGGLIGAAGYQGAMYATKPIDRKFEREFAQESPEVRAKLAAHRSRTGVSGSTPIGDPKWLKYHRTYPMRLPGAKFKRGMSYAHAGKTGVALTTLAAASAALIGVQGNRTARKGAVSKGLLVPRVRIPGGSLMRKPSIKASHISTSASGRKFTVRGSVK